MIHTATSSVKFRRLTRVVAELCGVSKVTAKVLAVGHLELLWHLAINSAKRGDIGHLDNIEIADEIGWEGDPDDIIDALVDCGWLDLNDEHRLVIHDWEEHAPGFIKRNIARVGGFAGASKKPLACSGEYGSARLTTQLRTEAATPNLTQPNLTQHNQTGGVVEVVVGRTDPDEVRRQASKLAKAIKTLDRTRCWQIAWVATAIQPGMLTNLLERIRDGGVEQPRVYIEVAIQKACQNEGYSWAELREAVPPPPEPAKIPAELKAELKQP